VGAGGSVLDGSGSRVEIVPLPEADRGHRSG